VFLLPTSEILIFYFVFSSCICPFICIFSSCLSVFSIFQNTRCSLFCFVFFFNFHVCVLVLLLIESADFALLN
jgi:hypothetical protein